MNYIMERDTMAHDLAEVRKLIDSMNSLVNQQQQQQKQQQQIQLQQQLEQQRQQQQLLLQQQQQQQQIQQQGEFPNQYPTNNNRTINTSNSVNSSDNNTYTLSADISSSSDIKNRTLLNTTTSTANTINNNNSNCGHNNNNNNNSNSNSNSSNSNNKNNVNIDNNNINNINNNNNNNNNNDNNNNGQQANKFLNFPDNAAAFLAAMAAAAAAATNNNKPNNSSANSTTLASNQNQYINQAQPQNQKSQVAPQTNGIVIEVSHLFFNRTLYFQLSLDATIEPLVAWLRLSFNDSSISGMVLQYKGVDGLWKCLLNRDDSLKRVLNQSLKSNATILHMRVPREEDLLSSGYTDRRLLALTKSSS